MAHVQALTIDDILKLKAIVLYIVNQCETVDIFHILKILYFAEQQYLMEFHLHCLENQVAHIEKQHHLEVNLQMLMWKLM